MKKLKSRGSILILALWSLSLLTAFTVSLGYGVRQKAALFERLDSLNFLYPAAYSGVEAARGLVKVDDATPNTDGLMDDWATNKSLFEKIGLGDRGYCTVSYAEKKVGFDKSVTIYGLSDEQSKININTSDVATLTRVLQIGGELGKETAEEIAYCIIDWRDTDSALEHPNYGAESDYYEHLSAPYSAKNAPFESLDELLLVKGINREIFDKIKQFITPFGTGAVNINTASKEVLLALGLEDRTAQKIISYREGKDKEERTADDQYFIDPAMIGASLDRASSLDHAEVTVLNNLISGGQLDTKSSHFMVLSKGVLNKNGATVQMEAVIDRKGNVYYLRASNIQWPSQV